MANSKTLNQAFKWFGEKNYKKAGEAFLKLLKDPKTDEWVKSRVKQYHRIVEDRLGKKTKTVNSPSMAEVSVLMNLGEFGEAKKLIAKTKIPEDAALFLKSEIALEEGDTKSASSLLEKAIDLNQDNRGYARNCPSFQPFLNDAEFQFLMPSS